jgi:MFS family permease
MLAPLLAAELTSTTGATMTALALPWLVLSSSGSPTRAGLVAAAEWVPMALLGIPSGVLAGKLGARRTMLVCDGARAPIVALVPLLYWLGALPFGVLLALAFLIGAFFPAHFASQRTILPDLLGEQSYDVTRGNVMLQAANRLPLMAGPALAGILIGLIGAPAVLLVDAGSYVIAWILVRLFVPVRFGRPSRGLPEERALLAGARCLAGDRLLGSLTFANAGIELAMQMVFLSLPILAYTAYDQHVGIAAGLLTAWGAGALAGMPLAAWLANRNPVRLVQLGLLGQTLPLWVLAFHLPPWVLAIALVAAGLANPVAGAPTMSLITLSVPEGLRSKAMLAFVTAATAAGGVGLLVAGPTAEAVGAHALLACAAGLATACAVGFSLAAHGTRARIVV